MAFFLSLFKNSSEVKDVYQLKLFFTCHFISLAMACMHSSWKCQIISTASLLLLNVDVSIWSVGTFEEFWVENADDFCGILPSSLLSKVSVLCLREMFFHRNMQNIFVFFWLEIEIAVLHATKVQQVRKTLDDYKYIYSCASRAGEKPVLMTSFLTVNWLHNSTVVCWQAGKMFRFLWIEAFMCKIYSIFVVVVDFNCSLAVQRLSSIYILK